MTPTYRDGMTDGPAPDTPAAPAPESSTPAAPDTPEAPAPARGGHPVLRYTAWRVLLLVAVWAPLQFLTPLRGVLAIVLAFLISGAISLFVLDRQRERAGRSVGGYFGRLNARIEESKRAEDVD